MWICLLSISKLLRMIPPSSKQRYPIFFILLGLFLHYLFGFVYRIIHKMSNPGHSDSGDNDSKNDTYEEINHNYFPAGLVGLIISTNLSVPLLTSSPMPLTVPARVLHPESRIRTNTIKNLYMLHS